MPDPTFFRGRRLAAFGAGVLCLTATSTLVGWALDIDVLKRVHHDWPSQKPNTALGLLLAGTALGVLARAGESVRLRTVARLPAATVAVLALLTFPGFLLGTDLLGIDEWLVAESPADFDSTAPGRMALVTDLNLLFLGLALIAATLRSERWILFSQLAAVVGASSAIVALCGFAYSTPASHRFMPFSSVAVHTAAALMAGWLGVAGLRADRGLISEIRGASQGALLARRLIPATLSVSFALGLAAVVGHRAQLWGAEYGTAQLVAANAIVFAVLAWIAARSLNRAERARREESRRAAEADERRRRFFDQVATGVCITDLDGRIRDCNPALLRVLGLTDPKQCLGAAVQSLLSLPAPVERLRDLLPPGEEANQFEVEASRRDGQRMTLLLDVSAELDAEGGVDGLCLQVRDVTHQRSIEARIEQAGRLEAVGRLAGGIAHDFNNQLTVMLAYTDLLLDDVRSDDPAREAIPPLRDTIERAAALTRQLQTFSGDRPKEPEPGSVRSTVEGMEEMLGRLLGEGIALSFDLAPEPDRVRADQTGLEQVLMNLAVNARDAMQGQGSLTFRTRHVELDDAHARAHPVAATGPHVLLEVADTGPGMTGPVRDRIFEPFFTTKARGEGTGLGLATVYGIVRRAGGHIDVETAPGQGCRFRLYFPLLGEGPVDTATAPEAPAYEGELRGSERILVVEDEAEVRGVVLGMLRRHGYDASAARDLPSALVLLQRSPVQPRLLLTDMILPGGSGPEVALRLQEELPELAVLFMSGYADQSVPGPLPDKAHFLAKPFTERELLKKVRSALDEGRSRPTPASPAP